MTERVHTFLEENLLGARGYGGGQITCFRWGEEGSGGLDGRTNDPLVDEIRYVCRGRHKNESDVL